MSERPSSSTPRGDGGPSWPLPGPALSRIALTLGLVATGLILVFTVGMNRGGEPNAEGAAPPSQPESRPEARSNPQPTVPAKATAAPVDRPSESDEDELDTWSRQIARATGIPARAAAAYGRAEMWLRGDRPGCHLSWSTLAAIGQVESRHGAAGGEPGIGVDGVPATPIVGPPLDGSQGRAEVQDTDRGEIDGDATWDRAVGPMRFLPAQWERWGKRATGDGRAADPQDIDDAALTAARLLCAEKRDLATADGWWNAVGGFRGPVTSGGADEYAGRIADQADVYAGQAPG
ncbi:MULTISPECIES: murein transglycosylase [Prauserella salsuginis group]|uniref:Murein transglycosylase n=1 Tax=Prauserella salsuginis TaxID=387889 RepID=A0ABW6G8Q6_9PSEU|nr:MULTISPECIES: murein transglycosylase [Prauserella salsuginis group]